MGMFLRSIINDGNIFWRKDGKYVLWNDNKALILKDLARKSIDINDVHCISALMHILASGSHWDTAVFSWSRPFTDFSSQNNTNKYS